MSEPNGSDAASLALEPMRYFSHDSDAREDMKCRYLRSRYGMAGYGRWWVLCEMLAQQRGHRFDWNVEMDRWCLCDELGMAEDETASFLGFLAETGLIVAELWDGGIVASDRMSENSMWCGVRKERAFKGAKARWSEKGSDGA